ncbi:MAG: DUF3332 family protein [bacterium]
MSEQDGNASLQSKFVKERWKIKLFGSFTLTKKVYKWNGSIGDKWINELVFLVFLAVPVYEIAGTIDVLILHTIEFWSGKNPATAENSIDTGDPLLSG